MLLRLSGLLAIFGVLLGMALMLGATAAAARLPRHELAFVGYHGAQSDLFLFDATRAILRNLTRSTGYDLSPAWSPDGQSIAFISDRELGLHVYVMDASGQNILRLTPPGRAYEFPRWSPDGTRLAFIARGSAGADVFTVNADGSGYQQVSGRTADPGSIMLELGMDAPAASGPQSPTNTGFLSVDFVDDAGWALMLSTAEGEPGAMLASLGRLFGETTAVSWSPDGTQIAYLSSKDGTVDLYLIAAQPGSLPQRITAGRSYESSPVWRPQ
jgi:TolB protein